MVDAGMMTAAGAAAEHDAWHARSAVSDLEETLDWARRVRQDAAQTTICLLLADVVIEQTQQLLEIAQEQLDRCNVEVV